MIQKIIKRILDLKYAVLISVLILFIISLFLIKGLRIEGDILEYMPAEDEDVRFFKEIGDKYLSNYLIMLSIDADRDNGVFSKEYLKKIDEMTEALKDIEGVFSVISLTNIMDIKKIEDGIEVSSLIDNSKIDSLTESDLKELRINVLSNGRYINQIVSANGRYSQIVIRPLRDAVREKIVVMVEDVCKKILNGTGYKFYAGGWPVAIRDTNDATNKDLKRLTPIVIIISMIVLFLGFRTIRGVLLPILVVIIANIFTFAIMALLKKPVTIGTSAVPVILVSTGTAYAIHIVNQYYFHSSKYHSKADIVFHAISDKWKAVLLSALTTIVGFITLTTATLTTVVDLGIFMTLGIFFAFVLAVVIVPILLALLPVRQAKKVLSEEESLNQTGGIFLPFVEKAVFSHYKKIIAAFAIISLLILPLLFNLSADVNPINYFKEDAPIRKSEKLLIDHFGGAVPIFVLVNGDVKDPKVMYFTEYLEREIESINMVGNAQSVASIVADLNYNLVNYYRIPDSRNKIGNLWFFVEGNEYLNQYVTQEMDESVILARIESLKKSQVSYVNSEIRNLLKTLPTEYKIVRINDLGENENNRLKDYRRRHLIKRIMTELKIAGKVVEEKVISEVVNKVENIDKTEDILSSESCRELYYELEKRVSKLRSEFNVDIIFTSSNEERCSLRGWEKFDLISGKVIVEDMELEEPVRTELGDIRDSMKLLVNQLFIKQYVNQAFFKINIGETASKHIAGLLSLLADETFIVGSDFEGFKDLNEEPLSIKARYGGLGPVLTMLNDNLMKNQITSIIMALLLVFLLMFYLTRSFVVGLISMIPICFTLLVDFVIMSVFGIEIDDVTIVIASILIGVGIDYTIHIITGLRLGYEKYSDDDKAISFAIRIIGRAVFINTSAVSLGFIALMFGDFLPLRSMGLLTAVTMFVAAGSAVILIPAFVKSYTKFNIKEVKL